MRREVALALREIEASGLVAEIWTELALQFDGEDRWYLEALGIGAHEHWNECLGLWLTRVGEDWRQKAGRDIIWRSRASQSLDYQIALLKENDLSLQEVSKLLRAIEFQNTPNKSLKLVNLIEHEFSMAITAHNLWDIGQIKHI